ncbi:MAG: 1-(5-phosphoribosyl)-5-[(5-phosphoribosylamino)methylideneamino]imidazole-4-carboxamide isomerase [Candidatus Omnitrophota bacterium]
MEVIPAIDIVRGKTVRLTEGDFYYQTEYSKSPIEYAKQWSEYDIKMLHMVDLDGARAGMPKNLEVIKEVIKSVNVAVEAGGGIRDEETLNEVLEAGAKYAVIGTMALNNEFVKTIAKKYAKKVVVSIDARDGMVQTKGWVNDSGVKASDLVKRLQAEGIERVNYTDVTRDGTLKGPDLKRLEEILKVAKISVVASGGISTLTDLKSLKELEKDGLIGAILGKSLYEGHIDLEKAVKIMKR